ncbi:uncharacterized protein ColSpa_09237 [Colletotrichum spaethianum]|uniref:HTH CENPB-type domain-containing protein n=1 Tax=Colletotrichum spaethianum TaxID=700344 RepID=A0AA37PB69_9PEZI|nr:uncharacterized protein ColSpa_09237 [Colletotrichum spaethianum]GKT49056.1 hypothetical protein ColSpa_09237 [Colletotrichum spaethianum]
MPRQYDKNMTTAKKAAEVVFAAQQRASHFDRAGKQISAISIRKVARQYGVSNTSIHRHLQALRASHNLQASPPATLGRPRALTDAKDAALTAFVIWLAEAGFPALPIQVEETANYLRDLQGIRPVSEHFVHTWLADHPELQKKSTIKPVELYRKGAELDPAPIKDFFAQYRAIVQEYDLSPSDIWNANESRCWIGCLSSRIHVILLQQPPKYNCLPEVIDPTNQESLYQDI